jgi:hypothetical protein
VHQETPESDAVSIHAPNAGDARIEENEGIELTNVLHRHTAHEEEGRRDEEAGQRDSHRALSVATSDSDVEPVSPTVISPLRETDSPVSSATTASPAAPAQNFEEFVPEQRDLSAVWSALITSPTFWRFSVLTLFLINLNTIFCHLDATLPTYLVRCFGAGYPKGIIYSINPFIIMWLTPVIAALTTTSAHYDMIKYGGYVSAISPFFLVIAMLLYNKKCSRIVIRTAAAAVSRC